MWKFAVALGLVLLDNHFGVTLGMLLVTGLGAFLAAKALAKRRP